MYYEQLNARRQPHEQHALTLVKKISGNAWQAAYSLAF
jgi:hypothetical protein